MCTSCPAGKYQESNAEPRGDSSCKNCPAGRFNVGTGSVGLGACALCPAGKFSTRIAAVDVEVCQTCVPGRYTNNDGSTEVRYSRLCFHPPLCMLTLASAAVHDVPGRDLLHIARVAGGAAMPHTRGVLRWDSEVRRGARVLRHGWNRRHASDRPAALRCRALLRPRHP